MPKYSTSPDQPAPTEGRAEIFIPFTAHVRIVPDLATGKRWSLYRNLEKISLRVEKDLLEAGFNIATPIAFTPQFGDYGAKLTIVGFVEQSRLEMGTSRGGRLNEAPTTDIKLIHSGVDFDEKTAVVSGNRGGSLADGQDPTTTVSEEVIELRILLAASTSQFNVDAITHIEYNGIKYGLKKIGGRSFKV